MNYFEQLKQEKEAGAGHTPAPRSRLPQRRVVQDIAPPSGAAKAAPPRKPVPPSPAPHAAGKALADVPPKPQRDKPVLVEVIPTSAAEVISATPAPEPEIAIRTWEPDRARRTRAARRLLLGAAGVLAALGAALPTAVFPTFSIAITPKVERMAVAATEFTADTGVTAPRPGERRLPAIEVSTATTLTREYESSGTKNFQERARGTVLLSNAYSSAPQLLIANTRLQDSGGKIFRLRSAVTVPGASVSEGKIVPKSIPVEVIADAPGEAGNIGPSEFRIPGFRGSPKYDGFYAKSEAPFAGGFAGQARVVEAADIRSASEELTREAMQALERELNQKVPADPDFLSPAGARELAIAEVSTPQAGERRDRFTVSVTARGRLFAVRRSQLGESLAALLLKPDGGNRGVRIPREQPNLETRAIRLGPAPGEAHLSVSGELNYWLETDRDAVASVLAASTPRKAEAYLRGREEIDSFRVKRFPRWLWFIPDRPGGLRISIEPPTN